MVAERKPDALKAGIERLLDDEALRARRVETAMRVTERAHDAATVRHRVQESLRSAAATAQPVA